MLELYILRHGQTDFNARNIVQGGGIDSDLNNEGLAQANAFYRHYAHIPFDCVVTSGLRRTSQTVSGFLKSHPHVRVETGLNELNWGVLEGMPWTPDLQALFNSTNQRWEAGHLDDAIEGGESPNQAWARISASLTSIITACPAGRVLICTHGRLLRILLAGALGYGLQHMNMFRHDNTSLNILHYHRNGRFTAERLHDLSHLNVDS